MWAGQIVFDLSGDLSYWACSYVTWYFRVPNRLWEEEASRCRNRTTLKMDLNALGSCRAGETLPMTKEKANGQETRRYDEVAS